MYYINQIHLIIQILYKYYQDGVVLVYLSMIHLFKYLVEFMIIRMILKKLGVEYILHILRVIKKINHLLYNRAQNQKTKIS